MATRSTISLLYKDGTVKSIYCHNDGYFSYNGVMLLKHYNDFQKVNELIGLGSLSSLNREIHPLSSNHSFDNRQPGICVAYGRDRSETGIEAKDFPSLENFITSGQQEDYNYVYKEKNQTWYLVSYQKLSKLMTLIKKDKSIDPQDLLDIQAIIDKNNLKKKLEKSLPVKNVTKETIKV